MISHKHMLDHQATQVDLFLVYQAYIVSLMFGATFVNSFAAKALSFACFASQKSRSSKNQCNLQVFLQKSETYVNPNKKVDTSNLNKKSTGSWNAIECQVCGKLGHGAQKCFQLRDLLLVLHLFSLLTLTVMILFIKSSFVDP